jgi:hypothetical protein
MNYSFEKRDYMYHVMLHVSYILCNKDISVAAIKFLTLYNAVVTIFITHFYVQWLGIFVIGYTVYLKSVLFSE